PGRGGAHRLRLQVLRDRIEDAGTQDQKTCVAAGGIDRLDRREGGDHRRRRGSDGCRGAECERKRDGERGAAWQDHRYGIPRWWLARAVAEYARVPRARQSSGSRGPRAPCAPAVETAALKSTCATS